METITKNSVWVTDRDNAVTDTWAIAQAFGKRNANLVRSCLTITSNPAKYGRDINDHMAMSKRIIGGRALDVFVMTERGFTRLMKSCNDVDSDVMRSFLDAFAQYNSGVEQQEQKINFDTNDGVFVATNEHGINWSVDEVCAQEQKTQNAQNCIDIPNIDAINETIANLPNDARFVPAIAKKFVGCFLDMYTVVAETRTDEIKDVLELRKEIGRIDELERRIDDIVGIISKPQTYVRREVRTTGEAISINQLAKMMARYGITTGEIRLYEWMREHNYLCSTGQDYNLPTQKAAEKGLFVVEPGKYTKPNGQVVNTRTTRVTEKGQVYFVNKWLYEQGR